MKGESAAMSFVVLIALLKVSNPLKNCYALCLIKKSVSLKRFQCQKFNPITYGILTFCQLLGRGGRFLARIQKTRLQLTD